MDEQLQEVLVETCQASGAPAAAAIVVSHDTVVAQGAVGVRRLGDDRPVTMVDQFHIGSAGKTWTATLCAALVHGGVVRWETTPLKVFPELEGKIHPKFELITLEMLLRHTAGIPPYTQDVHFEDLPALEGSPTEQRIGFTKWLLQERVPVVEPGTRFSYSNAGYGIAAALVEAASGRSWEEMLAELLLEPLAMEANIGWPARQDPDQPWGHRFVEGRLAPHPPDDAYALPAIIAPAGDLHTSMPHYGRFLQMNLRGLQGRDTILPVGLIRHLHNDGQPGMVIGWPVRTRAGIGLVSECIGGAGTFVCLVGVAHARDRAVAVAANAGSGPEGAVDRAVAGGYIKTLGLFAGTGAANSAEEPTL